MMTLILGGSGSGKSAFAEEYACECFAGESGLGIGCAKGKKYYIATMEVYGEEGRRRVERHRRQRAGKGFETIEQPRSVGELRRFDRGDTVLLECLSNLVANEMFVGACSLAAETVCTKILKEIGKLSQEVGRLVIVSNNVFEDGVDYDASTKEYMKALGMVNARLAQSADLVVEVVVGIPVVWKGSL
ncbi:MAG: bifunctional adenosylcobinamide kinase/adenosylcobinamide-phosphate guanylyltransferase [Lachnospiraceae bacterium]|nr:bifunctional adenosylcobinamide kinase/adenosylcobinamide-phosphate guanylyltransferase [Lachnospiraceae bacterium]